MRTLGRLLVLGATVGLPLCGAAVPARAPAAAPAQRILFDMQGRIWQVAPDGSGAAQLSAALPADGAWYHARWSPDGTRLVAAHDHADSSSDIAVLNADGSGMRQITSGWQRTGAPGSLHPSWSPDGRFVVCERGASTDESALWVLDADGSHPRRLTGPDVFAVGPAWSPDGHLIAFAAVADDGSSTIDVVPAAGGPVRALTSSQAFAGALHPAWSPDGSQLAFDAVTPDYGARAVWIVNADGGGVRRLTSDDDGAWATDPAWSPDGRSIAYAALEGPNVSDLFVVPAAGGDPHQLTSGLNVDGGLAWGPSRAAGGPGGGGGGGGGSKPLPPPKPGHRRPGIAGLRVLPHAFRARVGGGVRLRLSEPAHLRARIRRHDGRHWHWLRGALLRRGHAGITRFRFRRLHGHLLGRGTYQLIVWATDAAGHRSHAAFASFRVTNTQPTPRKERASSASPSQLSAGSGTRAQSRIVRLSADASNGSARPASTSSSTR